ncbi:hypothetical protein KAX06_09020 [candidate division WOR-3 bacterium]|nr:hypothetical protein [candidate division WOR-3 bacterium]
MKCIFCSNDFDENVDPPEHIIPKAMGNKTLTCNFVCKECNHKLSPIEDKLIRAINNVLPRYALKVKNRRHKIPNVESIIRKKVLRKIHSLETQSLTGEEIAEIINKPTFLGDLFAEEVDDKYGLSTLKPLAKIAVEYYACCFPDYKNSPNISVFEEFIFHIGLKNINNSPMAFSPLDPEETGFTLTFSDEEHFLMSLDGMVFIVLFGQPTAIVDMHPLEEEIPAYGATSDKDALIALVNVKNGRHVDMTKERAFFYGGGGK